MHILYVVDAIPRQERDVPLRMARVLRHAAFAGCQDPGWLSQRLRALGFHMPVLQASSSFSQQVDELCKALTHGEGVWVCSLDTPLRRDNGQVVRALAKRGVELACLPGPSPAVGALVASGLPSARVTLLGMLPVQREARRTLLRQHGQSAETVVLSAPVGTVHSVLSEIGQILGQRRIAIALGAGEQPVARAESAEALMDSVEQASPYEIVIAGADKVVVWTEGAVRQRAGELLSAGCTVRDVTREIVQLSGWSKREVYALALRERDRSAAPGLFGEA